MTKKTTDSLSNLRKNYEKNELLEHTVHTDPFQQFDGWLQAALAHEGVYEANAMTLATVNPLGKPSSRTVLLKGIREGGFVFYTNHHSRKGKELAQNKHVALLFYWGVLQRQVRIEGIVTELSVEASTQYFQSRPKGSQIGAWASTQSEIIDSRQVLEANQSQITEQYKDAEVLPKPPNWGGYLVKATNFEFWQGRSSRLHDRLQYRLDSETKWFIERLAP